MYKKSLDIRISKIDCVVCLTMNLNDVFIPTIKKKALIQLMGMIYYQSEDKSYARFTSICFQHSLTFFPNEIAKILLMVLL